MEYTIEISTKNFLVDATGEGVVKDIIDLGIKTIQKARYIQVYHIEGHLKKTDVVRIAEDLLTDAVSQEFTIRLEDAEAGGRGQGIGDRKTQNLESKHQFLNPKPYPLNPNHQPSAFSLQSLVENGKENYWTVSVEYNHGVSDPVAETTLKGIHDIGIDKVKSVRTSSKYILEGSLTRQMVDSICKKLLANCVIQNYKIN